MGISVGDLAGMSHLGLTVRGGQAGLARDVEWAHVCELEDPTPWMDGSGLILTTGMAIPRTAAAWSAYVQRLDSHHMAGVAIAREMYAPALTSQMLATADELAFPVLEVAYEVPYLAITSVVNAANRERSDRRLLSYLRLFDTLRLATAQGLSPVQHRMVWAGTAICTAACSTMTSRTCSCSSGRCTCCCTCRPVVWSSWPRRPARTWE
jgi:purine catabolism regulator